MKKMLLFLTISTALVLTGCVGVTAPGARQSATHSFKSRPQYRSTKKHSNKKSPQQSGTQISLDDFTNLNLNNRQPTTGDLWEKLGQGLKIPDAEKHPEVQEQIRWFVAHPSYLEHTTERARPYLYTVYEEVKSRNLPTELVLLPINESAYYPFSYSSTGATGIWQLMPGTANDWSLKHNFWYDGRRDIFDSTNAALDYLTYLNNYFNGDWLLTIAAYNTGEGNVQKAITRNLRQGLPTDFWSLHLSAETRSYVPRLLALAAIIAHPDRYPVSLPAIDAKAVVAPVEVNHQIKLTDAARLAGISVNQLKVLNPGLSATVTDPDSSKLLLPVDSIESFKANVNSLAPTPEPAPIESTQHYSRYHVQSGDTLESIANHFNTSVDALRKINNIFTPRVAPGTILMIPNPDLSETFKPSTQINLDQTPLRLATAYHKKPQKNSKPSLTSKKIVTHKTINKKGVLTKKSPTSKKPTSHKTKK